MTGSIAIFLQQANLIQKATWNRWRGEVLGFNPIGAKTAAPALFISPGIMEGGGGVLKTGLEPSTDNGLKNGQHPLV